MSRILIAEDTPQIVRFLVKGLRAEGHTTTAVDDGTMALELALTGQFDLLLLDLGLPGMDGWSVLTELRRRRVRLPIIVLTARDTAQDVVAGLDGGADDYISKPFRLPELLARVRLRLRAAPAAQQFTLRCGDLSLDLRTHEITVAGRTVELSAREFALAEMFLSHPGHVLSREQLLSHVWGYDYDPSSNVVEVYVRNLRAKIGAERIRTLRGAGYRLVDLTPTREDVATGQTMDPTPQTATSAALDES
jgi:two-component system, OmpR family, copper resistance phosphate regulon response regulator CusR